ncbi:ribosome rescue GTPase HflX [Aquisalimonas asiatica]|uniref:ribosome rescue GTPase HflX n=1 Tax=Aquisalimonas asiatica TaxID=406100 RepID=UPI000B8A5014|nr:ribosome rescue GTPase HflX [Aquisalimonas asiatica]
MFDRPGGGERAVLVHLDMEGRGVADALDELHSLAESAGADVVDSFVSRRDRPDPRYFIGRGKVDELAALVASGEADLVLLNHALSPSQERNLEAALRCRVLDRTGLILDIFAQRARTHEGKLQVELAQLRHVASRLVRGWSHLERQKGGIGQRGPGETQLEMDRRMLGVRIKQLEKRLARVRQQREQGRQARRKQDVPTISLVGYTNAGKSTLFNRLTEAEVYADDRLFATLDTTLRRVSVDSGEHVILADTVGFIRDLPHQLVAAFRSTLEEATESQLLLHVVDASEDDRDGSIEQVDSVLEAIGANEIPTIRVFNKIDQAGREPGVVVDPETGLTEVWVSAQDGRGMDLLLTAIADAVAAERVQGRLTLAPDQGRLRARLFDLGRVLEEAWTEDGELLLDVDIRRRDLERLYEKEGLTAPLEAAVP